MTLYKIINNQRIQLTAEELAARQAEETDWSNKAFDRAMEKLRNKRNMLLAETDFYANSDVTMSDAMTTYRQALRDITNNLTTVDDVDGVTWPTKPSED